MPTQGPFVDAQVIDAITVDGELLIRWGDDPDQAFRIRVLHASFDKPVLVVKNEGSKGAIVVQGGGKEFSFRADGDGLEVKGGNEGASDTVVLKLGTSRPSITGVAAPGSAGESIAQVLDTLKLADNNTS